MKLLSIFKKPSPFIAINGGSYIHWKDILWVEPFQGLNFEPDEPMRSYVTLTDGRAFSSPRTPISILEDINKAARR